MNKRTCLYDRHVAAGALISPFGGFDMPIQYTSIIEEHQAVRQHCGVFDVSHMGEVRVTGKDAERYVNHIFTNDIRQLLPGQILYGMMLYPNGGTVDDLLVYKMAENDFFIVINAANIDKDYEWMTAQAETFDIKLDNQSDYYGQLAVQGPESPEVVEEVLGLHCSELIFYTSKTIETEGETIMSVVQATQARTALRSMAVMHSSLPAGTSSWPVDVASPADWVAATRCASR